ncbi:MAG TPA: hypothetical protein VLK82_03080 [Candidatus Tectomicrobia bacterium]|nr:hypothetical protein [Candidatus Tectomicrobia bacterium]
MHGLGNVEHHRGDFEAAIENYKLAASLYPDHMYAWHDMFAAHYELAKRGKIELDAVRHALKMAKQTGKGAPGLGAGHIAQSESILHKLERDATP